DGDVLLFQRQVAGQDARAQEDEVGVEGVEHAVIVDGLALAGLVQVVDLAAVDGELAGLAEDFGEQVQAAGDLEGVVVGEPVHEVEVPAVEAAAAGDEVVLAAAAVAEGGQLQQRQIEAAAVEGHQLDALGILGPIAGDAAPEGLDDL